MKTQKAVVQRTMGQNFFDKIGRGKHQRCFRKLGPFSGFLGFSRIFSGFLGFSRVFSGFICRWCPFDSAKKIFRPLPTDGYAMGKKLGTQAKHGGCQPSIVTVASKKKVAFPALSRDGEHRNGQCYGLGGSNFFGLQG